MNRRSFMAMGAAVLPLIKASTSAAADTREFSRRGPPSRAFPGGQPAVVTPNGSTLPWRIVDGVKVGHLVVAPATNTFAPLLTADIWGYNGSTPGPTIEAVEGDHVRIYVTNRLPEPTTVHWHGVIVPNGIDGVSGLSQAPIRPGDTYVYEFTFREPGTHMYHSHFDEMTQMAMGLVGMIVVHPKSPRGPHVDRDFVMMTHEWRIDVGARRPNPIEMTDFNVLTFNGKSFPSTEPLLVGLGERVRIRFGNLSAMDHHPIHIHGLHFKVTATDGGLIEPSAQWLENTVIVPVGACRVIEMVPTVAGDWAMHCHMTHHTMTQMGHQVPNMVGVDPTTLDKRMSRVMPEYMTMGTTGMGEMMMMDVPPNSAPMRGGPGPFGTIDMGGMFTILKVREHPNDADPNGWYDNLEGTVATKADAARARADGIDLGRTT
jgi:FtsP/CotA-like multicopper oxidase with cupredoxin domain